MTTFLRAQWKARDPKSITRLPWTKIDTVVIHYSGSGSDETPDYAARVRGIQNYHMDIVDPPNHWNDIAYNWLVARNGDIFQGRGWGVQSAATLHHNGHTHAICFLGSDSADRDDVTDNGRHSIANLIFAAEAMAGKKLKVSGHRDFVSTECPGDELYGFVTTKGWEAYRKTNQVWPEHFFAFAAWYLGEGAYKEYGPRGGPRPKGLPSDYEITKMLPYWLALRRFNKAREK